MIPISEKEVYSHLRQAIRNEMNSLEELYREIESLIARVERADQEDIAFYTRAAGSILHDFYTGIEKIFQEIAKRLDGGLPKGERWHVELLESMAEPKETRPPVISAELKERLKEYLGFRHLFRNIYGIELKWDKLKDLLSRLRDLVWEEFRKEMGLFDSFLQKVLGEVEKSKGISGQELADS